MRRLSLSRFLNRPTELRVIGWELNISALKVGIYLDFLGLREDRRSDKTGNIYYAPTEKAMDSGIVRTGFDGVAGVWTDWHIDSVIALINTMTPEEKQKAEEMRKTNFKIRKEMELLIKQEKEREAKEARERAVAHTLSRGPIHERVAELINHGMDRDEVMEMMGINWMEYDLVRTTHAKNQGICSCGWRATNDSGLRQQHLIIADLLKNQMKIEQVTEKLGVDRSIVGAVRNRHINGVECNLCGWVADE